MIALRLLLTLGLSDGLGAVIRNFVSNLRLTVLLLLIWFIFWVGELGQKTGCLHYCAKNLQ